MSLFVFNNQQKLMKSIPNRDLISVVQDQAINVSDTLFVEMPADIWSNLKEPASYLAVQDPYERFSYHMYKVSKHTTKAETTDIESIQIGYDELKAYGYIKDRRFNNRPVLEAATAIVDGTDWQLGYVDTDLPNVNTNFYYISRLEALSKLIEATGAEVRFRVEISGNKIIAKRLDLYKQLGTFKGKRFAYGSNLLEIIKEEDTSELYTALVGRGKGEETDTGGFGRRITFADIAWSKASGKPVDKPLGQEFIELPEMTAYYGYPDGEPRTGIVEFGDIEEPELLLKATYERLVEISRPQVQFKAKVQTTGDMQLGEEVAIIRSDLGFRYKTRVFRVKRDYLNNMFTEVELGDKLTESLASRIKKIDTTNAQREETIIQYIQTAANGKNKIFRGVTEPTEGMMVNDLWYKPIGDGEMEMYQWNGAIWELILSTSDTTKVQREVEAAIAQAEEAKQEAEQSYTNSVAEAERLVQAQTDAFNAQMSDVNDEINTVKTDIDTTITNVNQEIANNFTSLSTSIDNVNNIATQAQLDAIGALGIVNNVDVIVNQLNGEVGTLITRVDGNDVLINQVKSTADGTVQTVADHAGRLTIAETNVNGLQTTVASKADQSQITQLSNAITSTVKDAVDTLEANGRNYFHKGLVMTNVLGNTNFVKFGDSTPQGFTVTGARDGRGYIRINNVITGNGLWTVTFDLGTPQLAKVGITVDVCDQGAKHFITRDDNKQERVSLTVNVTNHSSVYNFVDFGPMDWANFMINNIKIEKGGKSTPYVIAIEDTASSSQMTQLSNQINLRVAKGDVVSQLNIDAGRTLISSGKIYLDGDTYILGTTFVNDIKAKSLEAITANITSIRSQILVTNVISSEHIQGGTAMVGKLFSSTASINELTSKAAFISNIKAIDISASRITTGTLNAANVNLINVNVSSLVGNTSNFVQSAWNGITSEINIDSTGVVSRNTGNTFYSRLRSGLVEFGDDLNTRVGSIGSMVRSGSNTIRGIGIFVENAKEFGIAKRWTADGAYEYIMRSAINSRGLDIYTPTSIRDTLNLHGNQIHHVNRIYFGDTTQGIARGSDASQIFVADNGIRLGVGTIGSYTTKLHINDTSTFYNNVDMTSYVTIRNTLNMSGQAIHDVGRLLIGGTTSGLAKMSTTSDMAIVGNGGVWLGIGSVTGTWSNTLYVGNTVVRLHGANLDLNGGQVIGTSDERLKTDITNTNINALGLFKQFDFVDFDWRDSERPQDRQFGLIAQRTPFLSVYDAESDAWSINASKQIMLNSLGIKELDEKVDIEIINLKKENEKLRQRIQSLEEK